MKNKTYKEVETEKQKGKRRFIERRIEEDEAKKEINDYDYSDTRSTEREVNVRD